MTYHPKQMMPCAIFFATKTDNHYISLQKFASKIPKATEESVIAPEYLLTQGLRFTFDVRHPHRGLEGGFMELQNMAMGNYQRVGGNAGHSAQIQEDLKNLETAIDAEPIEKSMAGLQKRIQIAHQKSSMLLKTTAITCDGYFLYTPSQIWLGAFLAADEPLATFYVQTILGPSAEIMDQVIETLHSCAALLTEKSHVEEKEELRRIDKKLYKCRNPEKTDITSMHPTEKRAGDDGGLEEEKVVKKRKLAEAQRAGDDPFGPPITR
jgi:cyclin H